ncbi:CDP-alcohol phosphatidyltransferase family protein [Kaistia dalseonensis]|uniref:CDP-diacylglycerol--glycerol-3-phosphate 3-phosphatidyltransferase n=1 Tax=Kaistia dalseonensis TaxID=410840 RepID=A0ABU0HCE2_9HYPH|nr:CDP-alcohol phosphatidyltransferase family protein [Kaistia dalseonensis]MCX5497347.1 CDP-alcohol phosphatidyltransferase family protein [Kaistia dalseonensis]MDQ0439984.1 CDP-diacylglycerol--glycerol-3-phosphate 3-phosphatidyltransferase [Kaistia dalseonensis]
MASVYDLKPRFQALLRPLVRTLAASGVTANQVTIAAALLSVAGGGALVLLAGHRASLLILPLVLFLRMALNAIDGMLAREHGQKSRLGAMLNETGDVVSDAALYLALVPALAPFGAHGLPIVLFVVLAVLTEFVGVVGQTITGERRYDGPMGKSDRAASIGTLAFAAALGMPGGWWIDAVMSGLAALAVLTSVNRARSALRSV